MRYQKIDDQIVFDEETNLMWEVKTEGNAVLTYTWKEAKEYCESLILDGYNDWRLPTIEELKTLVDYNRLEPAINTGFFPNTVSSYYWTSSTCAHCKSNAWGVDFYYGNEDWYSKSNNDYVRAVRG